MDDIQYAVESLSALRNKALMFIMANEYLCEDQYLIKFGTEIENKIQDLKSDIVALKKEYPGKFAVEIETDSILEDINNSARMMQKPTGDLKKSCASGELGSSLESHVKSISRAVDQIRVQVRGSAAVYTKKDSVSGILSRLGNIGSSMGQPLFLVGKVLGIVLLIALIAFVYLFFTMEKESTYLKEIEQSRIYMSEKQELIGQLEDKKNEISSQVQSHDKKELLRGDKIAILDLGVEIQKINQDIHRAEADIDTYEGQINDYERKVEEIKKQSFLKRLLRQN